MNFDDTARFFGPSHKLNPKLFAPPSKAILLCQDCREVTVCGIRRFCGRCAAKRKRASTRASLRAKRDLNVRKTENSLVGVETLTRSKMNTRCCHTANGVFLTKPQRAAIWN